jgi:hypothetical protein
MRFLIKEVLKIDKAKNLLGEREIMFHLIFATRRLQSLNHKLLYLWSH